MSSPVFDPAQYKASQHYEWSISAAGWQQHWALWERAAQNVNERLVDLAHIQAGHRVLDVATGLGEPAFTAAHRVGPNGWVVATDLSRDMLDLAEKEAMRRGIHHIEFREMDAEEPDLPAQTFHAILCRWALMFLPHLPTALVRLRNLLVAGGHLTAAVWGAPENVPIASLPMGIIRQTLHMPPPPPGTPGTFSLADALVLEHTFMQAGFTQVATERLTIVLEYASTEEFTQEREATSANIRLLLSRASAQERAEIWHAVAEGVSRYRDADGVIRVPNETLCVVGRA